MWLWVRASLCVERPDEPLARLAALQPTFFNPVRNGGDNETRQLAAKTAVERGGFWGPFVFP